MGTLNVVDSYKETTPRGQEVRLRMRPAFSGRGLLVTLLSAALLAAPAPASALSETLNKKTVPVVEVGGTKYIELDVFQDALGLEGDQTLTGSYRLFGSPGLTRDVVVEFSADQPQVLVNDKENALTHAPVMQGGKLHVPYEEFVALFLAGTKDAEAQTPGAPAAAGAVLTDVTHTSQGSITTIGFKWTARPDYRFLFDGDTATLQVVFKQASKKLATEEVSVESEEVSRVTLEPIPEKGVVVASIHLKSEVTYDSNFNEATGTLTLRLKGPGTLEAPPSAAVDSGGTDMQSFLARNVIVLDPGHGGDDKGVAIDAGKPEAKVVLELALRLKPLLEKGGFKVALTRNSEGGLALFDRLVAINAQKPGMVISLHANSAPNPDLQGTQIYTLKLPATLDPSDPFASRRGTNGPSADEINLANGAAGRISAALAKNLKRRVELVQEGLLMPATRVFAPTMTVEVAYLTNPKDRALLDKKHFVDKFSYSIYSGLYDHFLAQWKAAGGRGPAVAKLPDVPADLPPAERAAPAPVVKAEARKAPPVVIPESADAADAAEDEEPLDGPDEDPPTTRKATLPKAAAVPPPAPKAPAAKPAPKAEEEEEEEPTPARAANALPAATPSVKSLPPPSPGEEEEEEE